MRFINSATAIVLGIGIGLAGCGGIDDDSGTPSSADSAVTSSTGQVLWFRWSKGDATKVLVPHTTHVCGLSMVRGEMAKNTSLRIFKSGGNWVMRGDNPGDNFLQMDAVCLPLSKFQVNAGVTPATGSEFLSTVTTQNTTKEVAMTHIQAPIMMGLKGEFNGGGEMAYISNSADPVLGIKVQGAPGTHAAYGNSVLLGTNTPFYVHDGLDNPSISVNGTGAVDVGCDFACTIAPIDTSFCYLVAVSGNFTGAEEWVQVFPNAGLGGWTLKGNAGSGPLIGSAGSVHAEVQCLLLDQRRNTNPRSN